MFWFGAGEGERRGVGTPPRAFLGYSRRFTFTLRWETSGNIEKRCDIMGHGFKG